MKKQFIFFVCCLALVFFTIAQNSMSKFYESHKIKTSYDKFDQKTERVFEQFMGNFILKKETDFLPQKTNSHFKGMDWYEPDTINMFRTYNTERLINSYYKGNLTDRVYLLWESGQWVSYRKHNYKYNAQNYLTEHSIQELQYREWITISVTTYIYDERKNLIEELHKPFQAPIDKTRWLYTYDEHSNLKSKIFQISWSNDQWDEIEKYLYTYDENNNLIVCECHVYDDNFLCGWKETYTYDTENNLTEMLFQRLICEGWQWIYGGTSNYIYDEQNNLIELIVQYPFMGELAKNRNCYTYDNHNNRVEDLWQQFDPDNQWRNLQKHTYTYDVMDNLQGKVSQVWESNQWNNINKTDYTYNEKNNGTIVSFQQWENNKWVDYDANLEFYYNNMLSSYRYALLGMPCYRLEVSNAKTGTVSIQENPSIEKTITLYPNPVSTILSIENENCNIISEIKIYSIQGVLLINTKGSQVDVSSLPSGLYVVEVDGVCRKIVKQ